MKLLYRLAEAPDFNELLAVQNLSLQILLGTSLDEAILNALIKDQHQKRSQLNELIVVAVCNEKIIGFIAFLPRNAQITGLFVHPDFVRQGIGSELLAAAIEILDSQKRRTVYVWSSEYAKPFYRQNGFRSAYSRYLLLGRHLKVRIFWMNKLIRPLTDAEKKRNTVIVVILSILTAVSLAVALS
ncbi:GCN5-related N-acetyltransferase [[Leptolyngbya] sp. PCC 7376]|uniref:GNAT family N-acetyltransferase n=1 Tax=[Leptolyngbya] sp. PCC 7376 TaxID=111781 RepID=UPI00029F4484|nr:GNAT family N-acetyltransferase [[Leptolyngbya] sp. PCC 7376]AFY38050.1 GCN5-related N-acetyltransferase [[Leptolyngbya] sp. PCC 7376]